jgi:indole-3-glycerol phosphate synthase
MSAPDLLRAIVAGTRRSVETRRGRESLRALRARAEGATPDGHAFETALGQPGRINVIAECKRRSPSKGVLMADYDPVPIARAYEAGGAAAISVLTEPTFFDGTLEHLAAVRRAVRIPLLRKDFILDEYQLYEARASGADAILLIVTALEQDALVALQAGAWAMGLAAVVEVHDEKEVDRAVEAGARLIGVNNRNLRTLQVDVEASHRLGRRIPAGVIAVSESGLGSRRDLDALIPDGYRAFLIGERFMTDPDPRRAIAELTRAASRHGTGARATA